MQTFNCFDELQQKNPELYATIERLMNDGRYVNFGSYHDFRHDDKRNFHFVSDNWDYLTPGQFERLFSEAMYREQAKNKSLKEYLSQLHYDIETVKITEFGETYYVPSGTLSGWLNGMFVGIDKDGNINS